MDIATARRIIDDGTTYVEKSFEKLEFPPTTLTGLGRHIREPDGSMWFYNPADDRDDELSYLAGSITYGGSRTFASLTPREKLVVRNIRRLFLSRLVDPTDHRPLAWVNVGLIYNDGRNMKIIRHNLNELNKGAPEPKLEDFAPYIVDRPSFPSVEEAISLGLRVMGDMIERYRHCGDDGIELLMNAIESDVFGTVTWFSHADFLTSPIFHKQRSVYDLPLGMLESGEELHYKGELSLAAIAPPGSGKTQAYVLPTLATYEGSAIVLDVRGECWDAWNRVPVAGVESILFSPEHPRESAHYNPLDFVSRDPLYLFEDARVLAQLVVAPDPSTKEPFWNDAARDMLANLIAVTVAQQQQIEALDDLDAKCDMRTVCSFAWASQKELMALILMMRETNIEALVEGANSMENLIFGFGKEGGAEKTFHNIQETLRRHLTPWRGPLVRSVTDKSDWQPEQMRDRPMRVYIKVSPKSIQPLNALLRVIIGQHLHQLMPSWASRKSKVPILVMLDELPQLGFMEPVRQAVEVGRGYGIRSWLFAQYLGQLEDAYGKEIARGLVNACGVQIVMNPNGEDAQELSELLGYRTDVLNGERRPFVEPQDLSGPAYREYAIIKGTGEKPAKVRKQYFWQMYPDRDDAA